MEVDQFFLCQDVFGLVQPGNSVELFLRGCVPHNKISFLLSGSWLVKKERKRERRFLFEKSLLYYSTKHGKYGKWGALKTRPKRA
jgi:hypothetical protein